MFIIPKDLEVKLAFAEKKMVGIRFQIKVQDILVLFTIPLMMPIILAMFNMIPDFISIKILTGVLLFSFSFYFFIWGSPIPKLNNFQRLIIWLKRSPRVMVAPPTGYRSPLYPVSLMKGCEIDVKKEKSVE